MQQLQTETADWFEQWFGSPYYKILYNNHDEGEARRFVETLMAYLQPKAGATMLDIACGEGRFARQLAELGFDVTGIDLSVRSITEAQKHEHSHLHFLVQDMRFIFNTNYYDYAFNFFTSFGYFKYDRDNDLAARAFAAGLKKGGILVIDYMNSPYILQHLIPESTIERGGYTFHIKKRIEQGHIIKQIRFKDAAGGDRQYEERVSAFTYTDLQQLFTKAGLELVGTFGDYQLGSYNEASSTRLIMIFRK
ncbi:MAG: class I SAM-dependent methyltransferase [Chitinophagia bacterium]|nr:class I SAM-dependent methyltransferase [Chitinophagia bacterium]